MKNMYVIDIFGKPAMAFEEREDALAMCGVMDVDPDFRMHEVPVFAAVHDRPACSLAGMIAGILSDGEEDEAEPELAAEETGAEDDSE